MTIANRDITIYKGDALLSSEEIINSLFVNSYINESYEVAAEDFTFT